MEVIKALLIQYGPTILTAIMSAILAYINKKLSTTNELNMKKVKEAVEENITKLDTASKSLELQTKEELNGMRDAISTMAIENAQLRKKLNRVIQELYKVEVQNGISNDQKLS